MNPSVASAGLPTTTKISAPQLMSDPQLWPSANPPFMPHKNTAIPATLSSFSDSIAPPPPSQQVATTAPGLQSASLNQPEAPMDANMISDCYASLLGLAETFRTMSPPNMRLAVHCLKAALNFKLPVNLEARTHLQIGRLLFHYSKSDEQTKSHLEKARTLGAHLRAKDDSIKFEAAALLAEFFERKVNETKLSLTPTFFLYFYCCHYFWRLLPSLGHSFHQVKLFV